MTSPYRLEDVLAREDVKKLPEGLKSRVSEVYVEVFANYEKVFPYSHDRLPGIVGVQVYVLNQSIAAYGSAVREAQRLRGGK